MTKEPPLFAGTYGEARAARYAVAADRKESRASADYYPTPPSGTRALLTVERFHGTIWEPACGAGHMSKVLEEAGYTVMSSDLVDRGYGEAGVDFLCDSIRSRRVPNVVTNPPYIVALPFVRRALEVATSKVAMLLRLSWLEGVERGKLFREHPPSRVWVFSKRLTIQRSECDIHRDAGGMVAFCWMVWDKADTSGETRLGWINPVR